MSGLRVVNDLEFTVHLICRTIDFTLPWPQPVLSAMPDLHFGLRSSVRPQPDRQRPVQIADGPAGLAQHNVRTDLVLQPDYHGNRKPRATKVCDSSSTPI